MATPLYPEDLVTLKRGRYPFSTLVRSDLLEKEDELEQLPVIAKMLKKAWCKVGETSQILEN